MNVKERVYFIGQLPHDQVPQYLAASDLLAATYKQSNFFYFSPLKIVEYMAMGKPIIATSLGQINELLADGGGILVEPGDSARLVKEFNRLIEDHNLLRTMGLIARTRVLTKYTWEQNAERVD